MKYIPVALLLLLGSTAMAQQPDTYVSTPALHIDSDTQRALYKGSVPVAATSQENLYSRAQDWLTQATRTHTLSTRTNSAEAGFIKTHVLLRDGQEMYSFLLSLQAQENGYRYRLEDVVYSQPHFARAGKHSAGPLQIPAETLLRGQSTATQRKQLAKIDARLQSFLQELNTKMQRKPEGLALR
ncbi:hypothetical protein MUN82_19215 [Hymenobacter aerilatus]|uniref:DUF4468 domain-containing protein n=1 Tax=Hymenobacter aerilatus TaxID=2932251 RepID=A0A8T9SVT7_9BACT|nr:hypothetical protein [Hymenobacter aerilatus]UOR05054.1 hypothetical protein MUN82_19215 [Hymenobacter aerilatus]